MDDMIFFQFFSLKFKKQRNKCTWKRNNSKISIHQNKNIKISRFPIFLNYHFSSQKLLLLRASLIFFHKRLTMELCLIEKDQTCLSPSIVPGPYLGDHHLGPRLTLLLAHGRSIFNEILQKETSLTILC